MTERLEQQDLQRTEARLRAAVLARTVAVRSADEAASLAAIQARVVPARRRALLIRRGLGVLAVAAAVAVVIGLATLVGDEDRRQLRTTGPDITTSTTLTRRPPPTTAPIGAPAFADEIWPPPSHAQYPDPVDAVRSFVEEYVGYRNPPLSAFRAGSGSTGEVDVHLVGEGGSVLRDRVAAVVSVRRTGGVWTVTGARSSEIVVDSPQPLATVQAPAIVTGRSSGYEGTIFASVIDGGGTPSRALGQEVGIGGADDGLLPFRLEVALSVQPAQSSGSVFLSTDTGCSGCNTSFAVVPVRFAAATGSCDRDGVLAAIRESGAAVAGGEIEYLKCADGFGWAIYRLPGFDDSAHVLIAIRETGYQVLDLGTSICPADSGVPRDVATAIAPSPQAAEDCPPVAP
ncbi:MAG: hypothetical protein ACRDQ2_16105 [Gaiellales bacterium]